MARPVTKEYAMITLRMPKDDYEWLLDYQEAQRTRWIQSRPGAHPAEHLFSPQQFFREVLSAYREKQDASVPRHSGQV